MLNSEHDVELLTDHQNLQWFKDPQNITRRQARWHAFLQEYHLRIHHISGKVNVAPNGLSCRPDHDHGQQDNQ